MSWVSSVSDNVIGYHVYRSFRSGGAYIRLTDSPVRGTSYKDHQVLPGATYFYVATAISDDGQESDYSEEAQAIVPSDPPSGRTPIWKRPRK